MAPADYTHGTLYTYVIHDHIKMDEHQHIIDIQFILERELKIQGRDAFSVCMCVAREKTSHTLTYITIVHLCAWLARSLFS